MGNVVTDFLGNILANNLWYWTAFFGWKWNTSFLFRYSTVLLRDVDALFDIMTLLTRNFVTFFYSLCMTSLPRDQRTMFGRLFMTNSLILRMFDFDVNILGMGVNDWRLDGDVTMTSLYVLVFCVMLVTLNMAFSLSLKCKVLDEFFSFELQLFCFEIEFVEKEF